MLLLIFFQLIVSVFAVVFEDCGSAYELQRVNIQGCGRQLPCFVTTGHNVSVHLEFRAAFHSSRLDQNVVLNINHVNLRTNVTPELCDSVVCPVNTNELSSFSSIMTIPSSIALNQRGYLRWRTFNERGVMVLCYSVLIQTQTRLQKLMRTSTPSAPYLPTYTAI